MVGTGGIDTKKMGDHTIKTMNQINTFSIASMQRSKTIETLDLYLAKKMIGQDTWKPDGGGAAKI